MNDRATDRHVPVAPVLVVESDFFLSGEIRAVLEELGLEVHLAPTSEKALPWAKDQAFSLAVLDPKGVGDIDGTLAHALRERNSAIRMILLFPPEQLKRVRHASSLENAVHLAKPVRSNQLRSAIMSAMGFADTDQPGTTIPG